MLKLAYLTAALIVLPAAALAQSAAAPAVPAPAASPDKSKSDLDKVICRSQDEIGSRLERHQVCLTKQQWATNEQEAKNKVREMQIIPLQSH